MLNIEDQTNQVDIILKKDNIDDCGSKVTITRFITNVQ